MNRLSLSKVKEISDSGFRDDQDLSISAIPDASDDSPFGPLLDPDFANASIYDLQLQLDAIEDGNTVPTTGQG